MTLQPRLSVALTTPTCGRNISNLTAKPDEVSVFGIPYKQYLGLSSVPKFLPHVRNLLCCRVRIGKD